MVQTKIVSKRNIPTHRDATAVELMNRYEQLYVDSLGLANALEEFGLDIHRGTVMICCGKGAGLTKHFETAFDAYMFAFNYIKTGEWD